MFEDLMQVIGGLGLFLLGMAVMTDGLKALADDRLRSLLSRSTRSPIGGAITGAISTAVLQSSSATTLAAVGFVNAGLMTFPQALGIVFGANLGTTITGWLVALVGLKLKLGSLLLPFIFVGVALRLFGSTKRQGLGNALAGFGLIFVGISMLQDGMNTFSEVVTPQSFPPATLAGRLLLVLIGFGITIITQSSSAGVAIALTAVSIGNITLAQAAALVIGMDVGTTITAVIASVGGAVQARRTGWAHVVYNLMTAGVAFLLLTPFLTSLDLLAPGVLETEPELALVGFHSFYNFVGILMVLPLTQQFAHLIIRLVPEQGNPLLSRLDPSLQGTPDLAVAAVEATTRDLVQSVFTNLARLLRSRPPAEDSSDTWIAEAIHATQEYLTAVFVPPDKEALFRRQQVSMHILDHLQRLTVRMRESSRMKAVRSTESLREAVERLAQTAQTITQQLESVDNQEFSEFREDYQRLKKLEKRLRRESIAKAARGECNATAAITQTDAGRGLRRIGYHVWRIIFQLHEGYGSIENSTYSSEHGSGLSH